MNIIVILMLAITFVATYVASKQYNKSTNMALLNSAFAMMIMNLFLLVVSQL